MPFCQHGLRRKPETITEIERETLAPPRQAHPERFSPLPFVAGTAGCFLFVFVLPFAVALLAGVML